MTLWFCLASGPSQNQADIDDVRGRGKVMAVNNQVFTAPWADVLYACDSAWFEAYMQQPKAKQILTGYRGEIVSSDPKAAAYGARVVKRESGAGLGRQGLRTGSNSGYQAINLAWLMGAKTIVLLGYDMSHGPNGKRHCHADHPDPLGNFGMPARCAAGFPAMARDLASEGVRVINCSRKTALRCFERMELKRALQLLPEASGISSQHHANHSEP